MAQGKEEPRLFLPLGLCLVLGLEPAHHHHHARG
jgi:hypothetical protein